MNEFSSELRRVITHIGTGCLEHHVKQGKAHVELRDHKSTRFLWATLSNLLLTEPRLPSATSPLGEGTLPLVFARIAHVHRKKGKLREHLSACACMYAPAEPSGQLSRVLRRARETRFRLALFPLPEPSSWGQTSILVLLGQ